MVCGGLAINRTAFSRFLRADHSLNVRPVACRTTAEAVWRCIAKCAQMTLRLVPGDVSRNSRICLKTPALLCDMLPAFLVSESAPALTQTPGLMQSGRQYPVRSSEHGGKPIDTGSQQRLPPQAVSSAQHTSGSWTVA